MTMEFTAPRSGSPLPGGPKPYFLYQGEGEKAFGIDATRVVAWGESAGAHLAALLGLTGRESASTAMAGVVEWYGPADLARWPRRRCRPGSAGPTRPTRGSHC
jgi:acetyl esterase/lipase